MGSSYNWREDFNTVTADARVRNYLKYALMTKCNEEVRILRQEQI